MKITTVLLLLACLQVSAAGYGQRISISGEGMSLKNVFGVIQKQSGYSFLFYEEDLQYAKRVTIDAKYADLSQVLNQVFLGQPLSYSIIEKTIVVKRKTIVFQEQSASPPIDVKGRVVNEKGEPVAGVTVTVKGTNKATPTNDKGEYILKNVDEHATLVFSGVNIQNHEERVNGRSELSTIKLKIKITSTEELNIVVSTGYQTLSKERATGSFSYINNKKLGITNLASTNFAKGLEGIVPGVLVGKDGGLQIRGVSTIRSDTRPLIVVDGFPIESGNYTINPNDIEDITILKDAAAASIWGVRASNGVVVIKTKNGRSTNGKAIFDFTYNFSFDEKPDFSYYQTANTPDFIDFEVETIKRGWFNPANADRAGYSRVAELFYKKHLGQLTDAGVEAGLSDLKKLNNLSQQGLFYRSAFQRQFSLSIRGGGPLYKYYVSALYTKQAPASIGNQTDDVILNIKNTLQLLPKVSLALGVNSTFGKAANAASYNFGFTTPYNMFLDENSRYLSQYPTIPEHLKQGYYDKGYQNWDYNAKQELDNSNNHTNRFEARFNLGLDFKISKGLVFSSKFLNELGFTNTDNLQNLNTYYARNLANNWRVYDAARAVYVNKFPVGPIFDKTKDQFNGWTFRNTLTIDQEVGKLHSISAVVGTEVRKISNKGNSERYYNYNEKALTVDNFDVLSLSNFNANYKGDFQSYTWSPGFYERDRRFFSGFANGAYTYSNRYTLSGSARIDQSNLFGTDPKYRYQPIWSAGASWKVSGEKFMQNVSFVNRLIVRATYGISGNIGNSSPYPIATTGKNFNTQENMLTFSNPENQELRPERTAITNVAVDFSLFNHRLSGSIDYYVKKSYDLLGNSILDPTTGFTRAEKNTAKMSNKGVDLNLSAKLVQGADLSLDVDVNFNYNQNKVINVLAPTNTAATYITGVSPIEGKPLSYMYSYRWAGLSDKGEPQVYNDKNGVVSWAAAEMSDVNGLKFVGTLTPPFYGGVMVTLHYKGFSFIPQFTYKAGHVLRLPTPRMDLFGGTLNTIAQRWQKAGDEKITDIPRVYNNSTGSTKWTNYYRNADIWEADASFVRLRSLTLSYQLPQPWLKKVFTGARLVAQGNNLWLWAANKNDIDPDYYNLRSGTFDFPPVKNFVLSLNLNF